jgi:hypothetical protein
LSNGLFVEQDDSQGAGIHSELNANAADKKQTANNVEMRVFIVIVV